MTEFFHNFLSRQFIPHRHCYLVAGVATFYDITERKQAKEQLQASLQAKEVLLKEIHHRVKNNLQIISSLLNSQSSSIQESQTLELLKACATDVASMALHEQLYQFEDLPKINFAEYIETLIANLLTSSELNAEAITSDFDIKAVEISINPAIPSDLIINKVTNSLKYAFSTDEFRKICINLYPKNNKKLILIVNSNDINLLSNFNLQSTEPLCLWLAIVLTNQIR